LLPNRYYVSIVASTPDSTFDPSTWIRTQHERLAISGEAAKENAKVSTIRKLRQAFKPIANYLTQVAQADVSLKSYGAGHKLEYTTLALPRPDATFYQVAWETLVPYAEVQPFEGMATVSYQAEEWGFGLRTLLHDGKVGFENYDFGRKKTKSPLFTPSAQEALATFMAKVELYMVHIEAPEV
jgi:hypothetical protein